MIYLLVHTLLVLTCVRFVSAHAESPLKFSYCTIQNNTEEGEVRNFADAVRLAFAFISCSENMLFRFAAATIHDYFLHSITLTVQSIKSCRRQYLFIINTRSFRRRCRPIFFSSPRFVFSLASRSPSHYRYSTFRRGVHNAGGGEQNKKH